jgi:hypothetical protein
MLQQDPFDEEKKKMEKNEITVEFEEETTLKAGESMWLYEGKYMIDVQPGTRITLVTQRMGEDGMFYDTGDED